MRGQKWDGAGRCNAGELAARPKLGTSPSATLPLSPPLWIPAPYRGTGHAFDRRNDESRGRNDQGMSRMTNERLLERSIPDRSPGHAFMAMPIARLATLSPRGYEWRAKIDARRTIE